MPKLIKVTWISTIEYYHWVTVPETQDITDYHELMDFLTGEGFDHSQDDNEVIEEHISTWEVSEDGY